MLQGASLLPLSTSMILQLPPNATKPSPIFSPLRRQGCGKTICCQFVVSSPPFPAPDTEKCLTISFLVTSCGLSSDAALCAARVLTSKNKEKPISVIRLLKDFGCSHAQIDSIARKCSRLMVANPEKRLKPKFDFLLDEGFSKKEVADILVSNASLFYRDTQRGLISIYRFLIAALPSRSDVVHALKCQRQSLTADKEAGINMLREKGVSEPVILRLIKSYPSALTPKTEHIEDAVKKLIEMGVDPKCKNFPSTLSSFLCFSEATWLEKVKLYKELGWSESVVVDMFKRFPEVFWLSDERVRFKVDFFKRSIGWDMAFIIKNPKLLSLSLENRIIPRVSVLKVLMSKGLIKNKWSGYKFSMTDEYFFEKYVKKYVAEVPEIIKYGKTSCCQVVSPFPALDTDKCLTISFLITSCGLSSEAALYAARVVTSKNKEKPISAIRLLKGYGFSPAQIDSIARKCSDLMVANLEKRIKPKLDFLLDEGFSKKEVADILVSNASLFHRDTQRGLISIYRFLSAALPSRSDVVHALKCQRQSLTADKEANINMLREKGVSEPVILRLIKSYPWVFMRKTEHIEDTVMKVIDMGWDPKSKKFPRTLVYFLSNKVTWLEKVKLYKELGWSESEVIDMFKRIPRVFSLSGERLRFTVDFFKRSIGWDRAFIIKNPALLTLSLENRIIPRVSVLKVLMSKGLIKNKWSGTPFTRTNEYFFEKYVKKYVAEVPEIIKMYEDTVALEVN